MIDQLVPLGDRDAARYAASLDRALASVGADTAIAVGESGHVRNGAAVIAHVTSSFRASADAIVVHQLPSSTLPDDVPLFAATPAAQAALAERRLRARLLPEPVDPGVWAERLDRNPFADRRLTVVSIARLGRADAERLIDILVALLGIAGPVRMIVHADDLDAEARAALERDRRDLDLASALVVTGGSLTERFAAFRAAHVACAFGAPIASAHGAVDALWFDLPVLAFDDPVFENTAAGSGLIVDTRDAREIAAVLRFVAFDAPLRARIKAEGVRIRSRHAPVAVVQALIDSLSLLEAGSRSPSGERV
jgi:glycosyltransferase involved in cell wall biosynthesis